MSKPEPKSRAAYQPLDWADGNDGDDQQADGGIRYATRNALLERREKRVFVLLFGSIGVLFISLCVLLAAWKRVPSELESAKRSSPFSPMWDAVEFWEGDLVNYFAHKSIYRGPPTQEREQAWFDLWHHQSIPVDDAGVAALNKTEQGPFVQVIDSDPEHPTYGAILEVFHQLHCLNMLRQATWPTDKFNKSWGNLLYPESRPETVFGRMHLDHCIEALRQTIMCYGDITPLLIKEAPQLEVGRMADFNVHHKCRNFDKIVEYVDKYGVHIPPGPGEEEEDELEDEG